MLKTLRVLLPIIIVLSFVVACQKEKGIIDETATLTHATRQAINAGSLTAIKQSYSLLTNEEKQTLWDTKWNTILKNDANKLTSEQLKIVVMIKTFVDSITIERLYKNPTPGEIFIKGNLSYFEEHFSKAQLYLLIECPYFYNDFSLQSIVLPQPIDPREEGGNSGSLCTCYYSIYCQTVGGGGTCQSGGCITGSPNCGLTGTSNCVGLCR